MYLKVYKYTHNLNRSSTYILFKNNQKGGGIMALGLKERYLKQEKSQKPQEEYKMKKNKKFSKKEDKKKTPKRGFFNSLNGKKVYIKLLSGEIIMGKLNTDAYNKYDVEVYDWSLFKVGDEFDEYLYDKAKLQGAKAIVVPKHAISFVVPVEGESQAPTKDAGGDRGDHQGGGDHHAA